MFLRIDDALVNVVSFGSGSPPFVAHGGWTGSWELWQQPFETMSTRRRCVSFDHRGSGLTVAAPGSITASRLVADLLAVLDALEIDQCVLAGESMGCVVALEAVTRHPERFRGLVLVAGVPFVAPEAAGPLVSGSRNDYPATAAVFVEACVPEPDSEHLKRWGRLILDRSEPEAAARLLECMFGVAPDLATVALPTLVVHGSADAIAPLALAESAAEQIPGAQLRVLDGAGHVPTVTRADEVAACIEEWLTTL